MEYSWPGNVRELFDVIESACTSSGDAQVISMDHFRQRLARARFTPTVFLAGT